LLPVVGSAELSAEVLRGPKVGLLRSSTTFRNPEATSQAMLLEDAATLAWRPPDWDSLNDLRSRRNREVRMQKRGRSTALRSFAKLFDFARKLSMTAEN